MLCAGECEILKVEERKYGFFSRVLRRCIGFLPGDALEENAQGVVWVSRSGTAMLNRGELCIVYLSGRCKICCAMGSAWVTCSGRPRDYILGMGEDLFLQGEGKILISGGDARSLIRICNE